MVPLCGRDIWQISRAQHLNPEDFVVAIPQPKSRYTTFKLNRDGFFYTLALAKKGEFEPKRACVFLVELAAGHSRCGIYLQRPVVCQSYPMGLFRDRVFLRKDNRCPPNSWPADDAQRPQWRSKIQLNDMHFDLYSEIVERWNARVAATPAETSFTFTAYLSFVLNVYDRLATLDRELGADALSEIEANWSALPPSGDILDDAVDHRDYPWIGYLSAAREVVDGFYPEIEPQPSVSLMRAATRWRRWTEGSAFPDELLEDSEPAASC